jgi:hypothetical protein
VSDSSRSPQVDKRDWWIVGNDHGVRLVEIGSHIYPRNEPIRVVPASVVAALEAELADLRQAYEREVEIADLAHAEGARQERNRLGLDARKRYERAFARTQDAKVWDDLPKYERKGWLGEALAAVLSSEGGPEPRTHHVETYAPVKRTPEDAAALIEGSVSRASTDTASRAFRPAEGGPDGD